MTYYSNKKYNNSTNQKQSWQKKKKKEYYNNSSNYSKSQHPNKYSKGSFYNSLPTKTNPKLDGVWEWNPLTKQTIYLNKHQSQLKSKQRADQYIKDNPNHPLVEMLLNNRKK
jgi:hypothetical protein